ncbi:hypothetical protein [Streptomyces sp. NPDC050264]|uniref:hypothetical protein n=1 Tax=Streptomyces sp. NPDC050264 TaxID=3155038 RepID=UPI0034141F37
MAALHRIHSIPTASLGGLVLKNTLPTTTLMAALTLLLIGGVAVGCGRESGADHDTDSRVTEPAAPELKPRAREGAAAWDGSRAAQQWRGGYHPMAEVTELPDGGLHSEDDKRAYEIGNFALEGNLPTAPRNDVSVKWADGSELRLRPVEARTTYQALARARSADPHLVVTGAKLGSMQVATNRGSATGPAWLFALKGYDRPLKRAAVAPSGLPEPPISPAKNVSTAVLAPLGGLTHMAPDSSAITVVATHGSCDDGPAVEALETEESVVLSASVANSQEGNCPADMSSKKITVKLKRPLDDRVLLDAATGRPVPYRQWPRTSPSWS